MNKRGGLEFFGKYGGSTSTLGLCQSQVNKIPDVYIFSSRLFLLLPILLSFWLFC